MQLTAASSKVLPVSSTPTRLASAAASRVAPCGLSGPWSGVRPSWAAWTSHRPGILAVCSTSSSTKRAFTTAASGNTSGAAGDTAGTEAAAAQGVAGSGQLSGVGSSRQQVRPPTVLRRPRLPLAALNPPPQGNSSKQHAASCPLVSEDGQPSAQQQQRRQGHDRGGPAPRVPLQGGYSRPTATTTTTSSSSSNSSRRSVGGPGKRSRLPPHIRQQAAAAARRQQLLQLQLPAVQLVFPAPPGLDLGECLSSDTHPQGMPASSSSGSDGSGQPRTAGLASASTAAAAAAGAGRSWRGPIVAAFMLLGRPMPEGIQQRHLHSAGEADFDEYASPAAGTSSSSSSTQYVYTPDPQQEWDAAGATAAAAVPPGVGEVAQDLQQQLVRPAPVAAPMMPLHDLWPLLQLDPEDPEQLTDVPMDLAGGGAPQLLWVGVHQPGGPGSEAALYVSPITSDRLSVRVEAGEQLVVQFEVAERLRAPVALTSGHTFSHPARMQSPQQQQGQAGEVQPQQQQGQAGEVQPPTTTTPGWYSYLVQVYGCWDAQEEGTLFPNMLRHCSDGRMAHNMRHAEDLAAFLATPQQQRVEAHAVNLIRAAFDRRRQPEWVLERLATMWGAEALARFGVDRSWVVARGVQELVAQQPPPPRLQP